MKAELETRYSVWIGKPVVLEQNDDHIHWLEEDRKAGWRLWPRYRRYLEESVDGEPSLAGIGLG